MIDGKTWYLENQTNASSIGILPGTGLVMATANTAFDYEASTRTAPILSSRIRSFAQDYNYPTDEARLWVRLEVSGAVNAGNNALWGFDKLPPYNNSQCDAFIAAKGLNPSLSWYAKNRYGSSQEDMGALTNNASYDVAMIRQRGKRQFEFWIGQFNTTTLAT